MTAKEKIKILELEKEVLELKLKLAEATKNPPLCLLPHYPPYCTRPHYPYQIPYWSTTTTGTVSYSLEDCTTTNVSGTNWKVLPS